MSRFNANMCSFTAEEWMDFRAGNLLDQRERIWRQEQHARMAKQPTRREKAHRMLDGKVLFKPCSSDFKIHLLYFTDQRRSRLKNTRARELLYVKSVGKALLWAGSLAFESLPSQRFHNRTTSRQSSSSLLPWYLSSESSKFNGSIVFIITDIPKSNNLDAPVGTDADGNGTLLPEMSRQQVESANVLPQTRYQTRGTSLVLSKILYITSVQSRTESC
jgi:hypothetical protein